MVKAGNEQRWARLLGDGGRSMEKGHRIHASRHCEHDAILSVERCSDGLPDLITFMSALCHDILI